MEFAFSLVLFVVSLYVLIKASDFFVESVARIARLLGVSQVVIGMSVVAIGTSLPELITSIFAAGINSTEVVIGTVVGSNIANIGLVVGTSALLMTHKLKDRAFKQDAAILGLVSLVFFFFALNGSISTLEGVLLLFFFALYMVYLAKFKPITEKEEKEIEKKAFHFRRITKASLAELVVAGVSLVFVIYGAKYLVQTGTSIASYLNVPPNVIAVTMIALGTSLPELSIALTALRKGYHAMLIGNIMGSNILNLLLVIGVGAVVTPLVVNSYSLLFTIPFMIILTSLLMYFMKSRQKLLRWEGAVLFGFYLIFVVLVWTLAV